MSHFSPPCKFVIRSRAIIVHEGKLLVVRHAHNPSYAALPGGHLEPGEGPQATLIREIEEELGVTPTLGRLLYVNTFTTTVDGEKVQPVEFFFAVENATDFLDLNEAGQSHGHELAATQWVGPAEVGQLRPAQIATDFAAGALLLPEVRFIQS